MLSKMNIDCRTTAWVFCLVLASLSAAAVVVAQDAPNSVAMSSSSLSITKDTFDEMTRGKTVFLKLYSPKCAHCKTLAPEWEEMAQACTSQDSSNRMVVGEMDCSSNPQQSKWCHDKFQLVGVPTILFGDPLNLGEYADDKSAAGLTKFCLKLMAQGPICNALNLEACDAKTRESYEKYWTLSNDELRQAIEETQQSIEHVKSQYKNKIQMLQEEYDALAFDHQNTVDNAKSNIHILQEVKQAVSRSL